MTVPEWLQRHLTELGRWDADGIRRRISLRVHECGERVVVGLDAERGGLPVTAQPDPIDELGELLAVAGSRTTYELRGLTGGRLELERRDNFAIAGSPAGSDRAPYVVGEHRCGLSLPTAAKPPETFRRRAMAPMPIEPPF